MAKIPFFGSAVHAALLHLANLQASGSVYDPLQFPDVFPRYLGQTILAGTNFIGVDPDNIAGLYAENPLWLAQTALAWNQIAREASEADEVRFEPLMPHGRRPDIITLTRKLLRVIDIKTRSFDLVTAPDEAAKAAKREYEQIVRSAEILFHQTPLDFSVVGLRWEFCSDMNMPLNPTWHEMCRFEAEVPPSSFLGKSFF